MKKHQTNVKKLTYKFGIVKNFMYLCNVNKDKKESSNKKVASNLLHINIYI